MPLFPFAKIALDIFGYYTHPLSRNQYIIIYVDMYSVLVEAFTIPNTKAQTIFHLLVYEVFHRFAVPLQFLTDNGEEDFTKFMKEMLEGLIIHHVRTSFYIPQSNGAVKRLHKTMHDILSKRLIIMINHRIYILTRCSSQLGLTLARQDSHVLHTL